MVQIKRWRPCPMAGRQNAYEQRFWCHDRSRSEKMGGLDMLEAFSMRKPRASRKYTLGSHDYANTAELVFIIGTSLNLPPPLPYPAPRPGAWGPSEDPKIALQDARTILSGGPGTYYTPNLQRTDAHGGATGPINSANELHLLVGE
eukprot:scaffold2326_cov41-Phaeocystis_antarctica.AAC.2